jgi:hypothetical protein
MHLFFLRIFLCKPGKVALAILAWLLSTPEQLAFQTGIPLKVPLSARSAWASAFPVWERDVDVVILIFVLTPVALF